jgi:hypothetical protein
MGKILTELYSIRKTSLEAKFVSAETLKTDLLMWRNTTSHFLDVEPSILSLLYRRQYIALRLSYSYCLILLYRPLILESFGSNVVPGVAGLQAKLEESVNGCLDAALEVVTTIDGIHEGMKAFEASWVSSPNFISMLSWFHFSLQI